MLYISSTDTLLNIRSVVVNSLLNDFDERAIEIYLKFDAFELFFFELAREHQLFNSTIND